MPNKSLFIFRASRKNHMQGILSDLLEKKSPRSIQAISRGLKKPSEATRHYVGWVVGEFIYKLSLGFFEGNIVKYVCRHEKKNGKADLLKARDYIDKLIELKYPD